MRITTLCIGLFLSFLSYGQGQIGNSDMELWENVGAPTEEPNNWNSFKTGSGSFASFANKQIERSTNIRSGASGMYCARIWSTSVLGIVANGSMTLGQINMGSTTPANAANYNYSKTSDVNFSEALVDSPDSIVFWVKYTQAGGGNQEARMHAILHDPYDVRDPIDANSQPHVIGTASLNYSQTNGNWERKSVPFTYGVNPGLVPGFILITFAANAVPGGGAANDEVLIDDVSLIYNSSSIQENQELNFSVHYNDDLLQIFGQNAGDLTIFNTNGSVVYTSNKLEKNVIHLNAGVYFVRVNSATLGSSTRKFVVR